MVQAGLRPPTPNSHIPSQGSCASPQVPRAGSKDGAQSSPAAIRSQRALGACVPPVQHGGAAAAPPPPPPSGRKLSLAALRWAGRRPAPAGPLLAAAAARRRRHLPDMPNSRSAEPPRPAENKGNEKPGSAAAGAVLRAARRAEADCGTAAANQRAAGDTTAPQPEGWPYAAPVRRPRRPSRIAPPRPYHY